MADSESRGRVCERHGVWCPDGECADCNALARDVAVGALAYAEALNAREASDADIANAALLKIGSPQLGDGELLTLLDVARRCEANNIASSAVWLHLLEKTNPFLVDLPYDPTKTPVCPDGECADCRAEFASIRDREDAEFMRRFAGEVVNEVASERPWADLKKFVAPTQGSEHHELCDASAPCKKIIDVSGPGDELIVTEAVVE